MFSRLLSCCLLWWVSLGLGSLESKFGKLPDRLKGGGKRICHKREKVGERKEGEERKESKKEKGRRARQRDYLILK